MAQAQAHTDDEERAVSSVTRYRLDRDMIADCYCDMDEAATGEYVGANDYEQLRSAVAQFRQAFVIAVGDKSPFARKALDAIDAAMGEKP